MPTSFVLRSQDRGYNHLPSTGPYAQYVAGHPDGSITRHSSFNFRDYQTGRAGFGKIRVFGDEVFTGNGTGYNMHPHHNFVIMAFVLRGALTHINTIGKIDVLKPGDYYIFSAGSGGKHAELNIEPEEMNAIYVWSLPARLHASPSYRSSHFDGTKHANEIVQLISDRPGALPIDQDLGFPGFGAATTGPTRTSRQRLLTALTCSLSKEASGSHRPPCADATASAFGILPVSSSNPHPSRRTS